MTRQSAIRLRVIRSLTLGLFLVPAVALSQTAATYYPAAGAAWQRKRPAEVGMDSAEAVVLAEAKYGTLGSTGSYTPPKSVARYKGAGVGPSATYSSRDRRG